MTGTCGGRCGYYDAGGSVPRRESRPRESRTSAGPGRAQRIIVMSARICVLLACGLLGTAIVTGCTGRPAAPHHAASHHVASRATLPPPPPVTRAAARKCPKTIPSRVGPPGTSPADLFGWASSYGNGKLWVGGLGPGGVTVPSGDMVGPDGSISWKYGWWRKAAGYLTITGRRLDAPAPPLTSDVPSGYGNIGFQASGVTFPSEGCWQVTGKTAHTSLTFITLVVTKAHRAVIPGNR
jgi:hypothetical protein